jgi:flagellar L-ring protein FlgH
MILLLVSLCHAFSFRKATPAEPPPAPPPDPVGTPAEWIPVPGSLYNPAYATALTGMGGSSKQAGDLVTVFIDESLQSQVDALTNTSAQGHVKFGVGAAFGLDVQAINANPSLGESISLDLSRDTGHNGSGQVARNGKLAGTITCRVIQVLPNGNLVLRGTKEILVNGERQILGLVGETQARDISTDNTVPSWRLADAYLEVTGKGVVGDKQRVGWGQRVIDFVAP